MPDIRMCPDQSYVAVEPTTYQHLLRHAVANLDADDPAEASSAEAAGHVLIPQSLFNLLQGIQTREHEDQRKRRQHRKRWKPEETATEPCTIACALKFPIGAGPFDVILVDPPWSYGAGGKNYRAAPYDTMSMAALRAMRVPELMADDCAVLLWTTGPYILEAARLLDAWGLQYKTVFALWRKLSSKSKQPVFGQGHYTRSSHEFLLLAGRGRTLKHRQRRDLRQLIEAPPLDENVLFSTIRAGHSAKPVEVFDLVDAFFGSESRKVELFARKTHPGWVAWGLELPTYFEDCR